MAKNSFKITLAFVSCIFGLIVSGCNKANVHIHTFESNWSYDKSYHWHNANCGHDEVSDKASHSFQYQDFLPTYEEPGYRLYTCTICSYSYRVEDDPLQHNYSNEWSYDDNKHWHACIDEGYSSLKADEGDHIYSGEYGLDWQNYLTEICDTCGYQHRVGDSPISSMDLSTVDLYTFWEDVNNAVKYVIYLDGAKVDETTNSYYLATNKYKTISVYALDEDNKIISGGMIDSKILNRDKKIEFNSTSELLEQDLDELYSYNYLKLNARRGSFANLAFNIPTNFDVVEIDSDNVANNSFSLTTVERTRPIQLIFNNTYLKAPQSKSVFTLKAAEGYAPATIVSFAGKNSLLGGNGANGGNSYSLGQAGGNGGNGSPAINVKSLLIDGSGRVSIMGGNGGNGGTGGPDSITSNPGNGGNGGNGGNAINASTIATIFEPTGVINIVGGNGGFGGAKGSDSGSSFMNNSHDGYAGTGGKGANTSIYLYSGLLNTSGMEIFDKSEEFVDEIPEGMNELSAPVLNKLGNILYWDKVENANYYEVTFRGSTFRTINNYCFLEGYKLGGLAYVRALNVNVNNETIAMSHASNRFKLVSQLYEEDEIETYDFKNTYSDIRIPSTVGKAIINGGGVTNYQNILIENRATPLTIELHDVHGQFFGIEGGVNSNATLDTLVSVFSYGTSNSFVGTQGAKGADGANGGSTAGSGADGSPGHKGNPGGRFNHVLFEGNAPIQFSGGKGGNGGRGGDGYKFLGIYINQGGTGGNGGDGGYGLETLKSFVALDNAALKCFGGSGGSPGANGAGWSALAGHSNSSGKSGQAYNVAPVYLDNIDTMPVDENDQLVTPSLSLNGSILTWDEVDGANKYVVEINRNDVIEKIETTNTTAVLDLTTTIKKIRVQAQYVEGDNIFFKSQFSEEISFGADMSELNIQSHSGVADKNGIIHIESEYDLVYFTGLTAGAIIQIDNRTKPLQIFFDASTKQIAKIYQESDFDVEVKITFSELTIEAPSALDDSESGQTAIDIKHLILKGNKLIVKGGNGYQPEENIAIGATGTDGGDAIKCSILYLAVGAIEASGGIGGIGYAGMLIDDPHIGQNGQDYDVAMLVSFDQLIIIQ